MLATIPLPYARILVVDDEEANVRLLQVMLEREGYHNVKATTKPREVLALCAAEEPDLILLDLMMPAMDGFQVMEALVEQTPADIFLPILVLTADVNPDVRRRALAAQATDFLTKPFDHAEVVLRIRNLLTTRAFYLQLRSQNRLLEELLRGSTLELHKALETLRAARKV